MDTLRNSVRMVGALLVNSEMVYSFLMGVGWFFLLGWAVALVVACVAVFRRDGRVEFQGVPDKVRGKLAVKQLRLG
ncbi:MAG: hypothetical protein WA628_18535 [Terriglobales bacterium]